MRNLFISEHLSVEAADLIAIKLNLQMPFKEEEREKGEINMCRAWEEIKQDEYKKGAKMQEEIRELRGRLKMPDVFICISFV